MVCSRSFPQGSLAYQQHIILNLIGTGATESVAGTSYSALRARLSSGSLGWAADNGIPYTATGIPRHRDAFGLHTRPIPYRVSSCRQRDYSREPELYPTSLCNALCLLCVRVWKDEAQLGRF